ncbi:MAG: methyltransferase [Faecalibacterium sp.]|nr:methyltransferase [Faecalibacterium sp.]
MKPALRTENPGFGAQQKEKGAAALEHSTEILYNGTAVFCGGGHTFGTDALLLARFCPPHRAQRAADLCSGCGIVALEWHDEGHRGPTAAVELAPEASALLDAALAAQKIGHIAPVCADLRTWRPAEAGRFDLVACNPPYFTAGEKSGDAARAAARHESGESCTLPEVCQAAARLLRDGGRFALCHRPERLADVLCTLRASRLEPKRLAFVKNKADGKPWLFLVEAQKNRRPGLIAEPDILVTAGAALY